MVSTLANSTAYALNTLSPTRSGQGFSYSSVHLRICAASPLGHRGTHLVSPGPLAVSAAHMPTTPKYVKVYATTLMCIFAGIYLFER